MQDSNAHAETSPPDKQQQRPPTKENRKNERARKGGAEGNKEAAPQEHKQSLKYTYYASKSFSQRGATKLLAGTIKAKLNQ